MAEGPRYEQINSPALAGLGPLQRAQVVNSINNSLLTELVDRLGGEIVLAPGFGARVGRPTAILMTHFDDDGGYRLWTEPLSPEFNHPGFGTRWERYDTARGHKIDELWEVVEEGGVYVTLARIDASGKPLHNVPVANVRTDSLRRGIGWRRWAPPEDLVQALAGSE